MDLRVQVLVFRVVGVLSEAVRRHPVALTDSGFTFIVEGCTGSTGESERGGFAAAIGELSGLLWWMLMDFYLKRDCLVQRVVGPRTQR